MALVLWFYNKAFGKNTVTDIESNPGKNEQVSNECMLQTGPAFVNIVNLQFT